MTMSSSRDSIKTGGPAKSQISWVSDIPEIPLDLGISLEREELGGDSGE